MKPHNLAAIAITFLVLTIAYTLLPPKTIEYTEIEHGVIINSPVPNKMDPFTVSAYLRNNQTKTVHIAPFTYSWNINILKKVVNPVGIAVTQKDILKILPNETVILHKQTIYPQKNGTLMIDILGPRLTLQIERPDTLNLNDFEVIDTGDHFDISMNSVIFTDVNRLEHNVTLFKEFPLPVSRFRAAFSVKITDIEPSRDLFNRINVFTVADLVGDYRTVRFNGNNELSVRVQSNSSRNYYELEVRENHNFTSNPVNGVFEFNVNQTYYYVLDREPTIVSLSVYLDQEYDELLERLDLELNFDGGYPFVLFPQCGGYASGNYSVSGVLGDLEFEDLDIARITSP